MPVPNTYSFLLHVPKLCILYVLEMYLQNRVKLKVNFILWKLGGGVKGF